MMSIEKTFYYLYNLSDDKDRKIAKCIEVLKSFHNSFWKRCSFSHDRGIYYVLYKSTSELDYRFIHLAFVSRDTGYGYDKDCIVNTDYDSVEKNMLKFVRLVREYEERERRKGLIDNRDKSSMHPDIWKKYSFDLCMPSLTKVISSGPATIAFWDDGTKTVVKCQEGDTYDAEKGILYAILRKCMSNNKDYHNFLKETDRFKTFVEDMKTKEILE